MLSSEKEAGAPVVRFTSIALSGLLAACLEMAPGPATAAHVCERIPQSPPSYASRIATVACAENSLWYSPFIDAQGRLASISVSETERVRLQDGTTLAWQRVAEYWKGSGLLAEMSYFPGANDCSFGETGHLPAASCRAFLTDTPWSAAFVSFVMNRAGLPGFNASASHIDFIQDAYANPGSPYAFHDPDATAPGAGDLLCFRRNGTPIGSRGLREILARGSADGMNMHCDIVVAASPGDGKLYLVGGNVLQGVTMRVLPLNRNGLIWGLPRKSANPGDCRPGNEAACSFNRQDWVALLKLKPLPPPSGPLPLPGTSSPQRCCTQCPLPMPATMKRCPVVERPVDMQPGSSGQ